jgi:hypothetical protein
MLVAVSEDKAAERRLLDRAPQGLLLEGLRRACHAPPHQGARSLIAQTRFPCCWGDLASLPAVHRLAAPPLSPTAGPSWRPAPHGSRRASPHARGGLNTCKGRGRWVIERLCGVRNESGGGRGGRVPSGSRPSAGTIVLDRSKPSTGLPLPAD